MENAIGAQPKVRFGDWIGEGWNMFAEEWKVWVLNALVLSLVTVVPMIEIYVLMLVITAASAEGGGAGLGAAMLALIFVGAILLALLSTFLIGGMYHTAFKQLRGEPISTRDLFSAGDRFPSLLGAGILVGVLIMIGALLCIIPAFILAGALYFTFPLVVERRLSAGEAIQTSRDATRGDLFMFVLFALVVSLIAQAGSYLCYVGMLVTWPLQFTIGAIAYRDCFGVEGSRSFASKPAPPHSYGAPPQQWSYYGSPAPVPPSAVYQPPPAEAPGVNAPRQQTPTDAVQPRPTGDGMTCPDCQAELPAIARFCDRCGRSMIET